VLRKIYSCDAYYERVKAYLERCRPHYKPNFSIGNVRAICLSVLLQGVWARSRFSYWKFLFTAATRHRRYFGAAITMAVMGYHFQVMVRKLKPSAT